jgi:hypothetical protein
MVISPAQCVEAGPGWTGVWRKSKCIYACPCWGSSAGTLYPCGVLCVLLPTKTSLSFSQSSGSSTCFRSGGSQVVFTSLSNFLSLLILVAVSLALMALSHRTFISLFEWDSPLITLSQRSTQIRWVDSVTVICMRRIATFGVSWHGTWRVCRL